MENLEISLINQFRGKKIFLTGHTGFKGSWMLCLLQHTGAKVKGYALEADNQSLYNQIEGNKLCDSFIGDIRDAALLKTEIDSFRPDYIFHFAAQPLVIASYDDPKYTFDVNVGGSINVMEAFRSLDYTCTLLAITTDKVYKNKESETPYREADELGGHDPYSSSKAAMELVLQSYVSSFGLNEHTKRVVIGRAGNVIGGGDWAENRILPDIARSLLNGDTLQLRNPNSIRPWQHVLDALVGYLKAVVYIEQPTNATSPYIFNFGPDVQEKITVEELSQIAISIIGKGKYEISPVKEAHVETTQLLLDSSRANQILGWHPRWNGKQAIQKSIAWYQQHSRASNNLQLCQSDIKDYFQR
ncbi:CDP-glucose 4,6-dehydratase [Reichenbachiella sp. MSK19-1]|uniref:CDP-glucose 4,6-dehydratase n=1 Tax=Reichenbachiella sp. MSK19-1 TaxID=1897631 RepID=UPI000E6B76E0|nr:CDP-glucose 4,6-dehydratase [Reichenbachiella sp. MSK19-1]RJE70868.1 CDP-glucose 4,6-dehydratase [Reichenbachiella sp. MSK19-1]